jgi:protein-S-isoprenylcysteine O-methyltransferase Ste14
MVSAVFAFTAVLVVTTTFFILVDWGFAAWMPDGEFVVMALGFLILSRFYSQKKRFQEKYGEQAYRNAFARFNIPGLGIVFASIAHLGYMPGPEIPHLWWRTVLITLGYCLIMLGAVLWVRSVSYFGVDNLTMLYVYFPEESRFVDSGIYRILRHPIYAAALYFGIGLALGHANWYSLLVAAVLPIFLTGWIRLVEEKELIERFPDYLQNRKQVPAFWVRLRDIPRFYRFVITGA